MADKKMKKGKKALLISASIVLAVAAAIAVANTVAVNGLIKKGNEYNKVNYENQLVPEKDENGNHYFTTDGDFRVMHITDTHIGGGFATASADKKALNAIALMVTREKPDFVIATGDVVFPNPYRAGTFNNLSGARAFANLMEQLGVYWDVTFGNHDAEAYSYFDRKAVAEFYENAEYKYCLFKSGPEDVDGYGNHTVEVKNSKGITTQALIMLDSQSYVGEGLIGSIKGDYDNVHPNQIAWYEAEVKRITAKNKEINQEEGTVSSLAFFHIPLMEMDDAWNEFRENGYKDTESFRYIEGIIAETGRQVCCSYTEDELFEKMLELGSTKAMFNGHDHVNNTTFEYKGIQFSYGYSIDYLAYSGIGKLGSQRGCSIITCKPDSSFAIDKYNLYSDRYKLEGFTLEDVTMQHEDVTYQVLPE